ncbi:MAG: hypothetical protein ACOX3R_02015 [Desulfitobacteriia bacterium]
MAVNKMLLETYLKKLKMPQVAKVYESMAREAVNNNLDYEEYLISSILVNSFRETVWLPSGNTTTA